MAIHSEKALNRILRRWFDIFHEELSAEMKHLTQEAFNVGSFINLAKALGIDFAQLPGMVGEQPGLDPYTVLGLQKSASDEDIKHRYRDLVRRLHPDTAGAPGTEFLFQTVQAAYEMIKLERGIK